MYSVLTVSNRAIELLAPFKRFVVFGIEDRVGKPGKLDKYPIDPHTGAKLHSWNRPDSWLTFSEAFDLATVAPRLAGIGFVIAPPLHFLDLDNIVVNKAWDPNALELMRMFVGAYCEISISGTGAHVIFRADLPPHRNKVNWFGMGLELYSVSRFCALTGTCFWDAGSPELPDHSEPGARLATLFPAKPVVEPMPGGVSTEEDEAIIRMLRGH